MTLSSHRTRRTAALAAAWALAWATSAAAQPAPTTSSTPTPPARAFEKLPPALALGLIAYEDSGVIKVLDLAADVVSSYDLPERMEQPAWNPDGKRFTYSSSFGVSILDIPNQNFSSVSQPGKPAGRPAWSSDGTRLIYETRGDDAGLWVFDTRDKSRRPVSLALKATQPAWHPKADRLALVAAVDGVDQIFVVDAPCLADGTCDKPQKALAPVQLTKTGKGSREPAWNVDGTRLAFEHDAGDGQGTGIFVINADGSGLKRLSPAGADDHAPSWGAGDWLAFQRGGGDKASVCVMKSDGSGTRTLIKDTGRSPAWWQARP